MASCVSCGTLLNDDARFCSHCGAPVDAAILEEQEGVSQDIQEDTHEGAQEDAHEGAQEVILHEDIQKKGEQVFDGRPAESESFGTEVDVSEVLEHEDLPVFDDDENEQLQDTIEFDIDLHGEQSEDVLYNDEQQDAIAESEYEYEERGFVPAKGFSHLVQPSASAVAPARGYNKDVYIQSNRATQERKAILPKAIIGAVGAFVVALLLVVSAFIFRTPDPIPAEITIEAPGYNPAIDSPIMVHVSGVSPKGATLEEYDKIISDGAVTLTCKPGVYTVQVAASPLLQSGAFYEVPDALTFVVTKQGIQAGMPLTLVFDALDPDKIVDADIQKATEVARFVKYDQHLIDKALNAIEEKREELKKEDKAPQDLDDEDIYKALVDAYEAMPNYDEDIKAVVSSFNELYQKSDAGLREEAASSAQSLEDDIKAARNTLKSLNIDELSEYYDDYKKIDELFMCLEKRMSVINEAWTIDLSYSNPKGHEAEITKPLKKDNDGNGKNIYKIQYEETYPQSRPHEPSEVAVYEAL